MSLSGPRIITGRRKLLKAVLVGISGNFQRVRHQGGGEANLTCAALGEARRRLTASGGAALAFAASGGAGSPTKSGAGAAVLSTLAGGGAFARRGAIGSAALLTAAGGIAAARRQASGAASLLSAAAGAARAQRFATGVATLTTFGTGGGSGSVSDPIIQSINANGWSVTTTSSPPTMQPDVAPKFLYASRQGFDQTGAAKTYVEPIVLTQRLRQPYPNQASLTSDQVVLSDYLYSTDTVVGSVTGASTEASPKPIANWARVDRRLVGNSFPKEWAEVPAFHRNARNGEQVACVVWTWTDGTNTVTAKVGVSVVSADPLDLSAVIVYRPAADIDISSLTSGQITMNAKVYPWIGDASSVLDSSVGSANSREFCPQTFTKNPTLFAAPYFIYVDNALGNDTTGVCSTNAATAAATPALTVPGAIVRARAQMPGNRIDGLRIRIVNAQTISADVTFNTYQDNHEVIIEPAPGVSQATANISFGATANRATQLQWLRLKGVSMTRAGLFGLTGKTTGASKLVLENVALDAGSQNSSLVVASNFVAYLHGVTITNPAANLLTAGTSEIRLLRGVDFGTMNGGVGTLVERWLMLGCLFRGIATTRGARSDSGAIAAFTKFLGCGGSAAILSYGASQDVSGAAFVQNVCEWASVTSNPFFRPSADGETGNVTHLVVHQNTFAGFNDYGRGNILYNESTGARTHKLCSFVGNIHVQINTKHDVFKADGTRIQSWPYAFGVGCAGEFSQFFSAGAPGFAPDFGGLNASLGTSNSVRNDPLFTAPAATASGPSTGAGGGDYTLQAGSPCIGRVKAPVLAFDLAGNARSATASAAGAYERVA
ncbi:MAG: hypothetical protein J0I42_15095 [Bosea sp.]|uniref:hypothetical protein n=1 Tax=Bosea sp. (in: a-proteobacteria) TaxID=1871050 RepID=UPI001ACF43B4|nr:hypothetical protein [Bosea sp. (in: a-proteobacteria)]MBN9453273.1 hypothetical protein [Bosea sp. (in: a-proteobacteria)]